MSAFENLLSYTYDSHILTKKKKIGVASLLNRLSVVVYAVKIPSSGSHDEKDSALATAAKLATASSGTQSVEYLE